jgi:YesN/AraC family two-component response regulator
LAEKYYNLALYEISNDSISIIRENIMNNLGVVYDLQYRYDESLKAYRESLKMAEIRNDSASIVQSWINLGLLEIKSGNYDQSENYLKDALKFSISKGDSLNIGLSFQNLALLASKRLQFQDSKDYLLKSFSCFKNIGQKYYQAQVLVDLISVELQIGNFERALDLEEEFEVLDTESRFTYQRIIAGINTANALIEKKSNLDLAKKLLDEALMLTQKTGANEQLGNIYKVYLMYYAVKGDVINHSQTLQLFADNFDENKSLNTTRQMEEMKALYELEDLEENNRDLNELLLAKQRQLTLIYTVVLLFGSLLLGWLIFNKKLGERAKTIYKLNIEKSLYWKPTFIKEEDKESILFQNIQNLFQRDFLYRDPDLNLQKLAKLVASNPTYVTNAISQIGKTNFSILINRYRIEEAQEIILVCQDKPNFNEIAEQVGFNNRVSFYRWFKEITGLSPTEFYQFSRT